LVYYCGGGDESEPVPRIVKKLKDSAEAAIRSRLFLCVPISKPVERS
jgi:hypothetical protein